ncbi:MAG: cytochrome c maturation protein CcmE [Hydrogenophilales bacterium CG03_land_8_20_14_0_80_62_28]|nr:cytochrome c maturation protein CcmE [Betaproteobacteria bacterium]OIO78587.1 MAG: cytochrome c biogenesis protein CcmE [Hydrogenophilaceae bacterium CG1_02_62_390]PIV22735.1 MAG: cytochrome c maturation protein CcmE [Hydrogenophilales bacterium CG03_land_8_20_14_0_80_62_28]PIW39112.1 MAG: cytochrome c maturation protein CcmE [Hydrogenophilales bacterium CG15_BIG_FIL_POST_REV_8_21_14_020_62_31]PIW72868.1 MAG: cytochrome c maturation protein CcmE [Hydrogenophilales bacterium CG12_big_fil_rev_
MKSRNKKLLAIGLAVVGLAIVAALVLNAFRNNLVFFFTPTQVANGEAPKDRAFRIGGLVVAGTIKRSADGMNATFVVTDTAKTMPVIYSVKDNGPLPDLFKEGKGMVAEGKLGANGVFAATQVLAKHDENYMPPEAASAIAQAQKAQTLVK